MKKHFESIKRQTNNPFLNMFVADAIARDGSHFPYFFTSRKDENTMVATTGKVEADGAVIYGVAQKDGKDYLLLVKQYRFPLNMMIYELPAGLIDEGENAREAAIRECKEETGMELLVYEGGQQAYRRPFIQAQGICDESNSVVFGTVSGEISTEGLENREDLEIYLADKDEVRRILREEQVSLRGAYLMMLFLTTPEGQPFSFLE